MRALTNICNYKYGGLQPHAVSKIENNTGNISPLPQNITYTPFNKVDNITQDIYEINFTYGPDRARKKVKKYKDGNLLITKYYLGIYEKNVPKQVSGEILGGERETHYIPGPDGMAAVYMKEDGTETLYYTITDHLGSIVALVDKSGNIAEEYNFDPWGRQRDPTNWTYNHIPASNIIDRGFTGHEHLDEFALINMNGRMYAPALGTFISPDNYVQFPDFSQSLNRYSYALNNPLVYVDPDGEFAWFIPMIIGAVAGFEIGGLQSTGWKEARPWKWSSASWKAAGIGAIAGAGFGLGVSAGASALGADITKIAASAGQATSLGWDIGVNALMTSNINMLSSWAQGRDNTEILLSGVSGLVAGGIGGGIGRNGGRLLGQPGQRGIRTTNYWTSTLSGSLDRLTNSIYNQESVGQTIANTTFGAGEGLYSAYLGNKFAPLKARGIKGFAGRYVSSAISQSITSVPGLGISIASYHASYFSALGLGATGPLALAGGYGMYGIAPPFYGWAINKYWYSQAVVNPLFWLDKTL